VGKGGGSAKKIEKVAPHLTTRRNELVCEYSERVLKVPKENGDERNSGNKVGVGGGV